MGILLLLVFLLLEIDALVLLCLWKLMYLTTTRPRPVLSFAGIANPSRSRKWTKGRGERAFLVKKKGSLSIFKAIEGTLKLLL
jgi:hypothetical protein